MCCQYYFDRDTMEDVRRIAPYLMGDAEEFDRIREGDVHPSDPAVIIAHTGDREQELGLFPMRWGFTDRDRKLLINARCESALEKVTFRDCVRSRRCIIPAKHFYEWDRDRNKVTFTWKESPVLYMAGFYNADHRFIILTTAANASMAPVHDRMPLILPQDLIRDWILEQDCVEEILLRPAPLLNRQQDYQQMSLFDCGI